MKTYQEKIISFSNMTARVLIPCVSAEEREQRMKAIHNAAKALLIAKGEPNVK